MRVSAVGVVFGPQGIDEKKLTALLERDPAVVERLTDYAKQHTKVEALVQALSTYEESAPGTDSLQFVLKGFSSQYGVDLPTLDRSKPANDQAAALLRAITPAFASTSASPTGLAQQSGGLAASVASLFFGAPVGLAVGGAALAGNLHASLFPPTDFQAAFTQQTAANSLVLCVGNQKRVGKTRTEFVWMMQLPDADAPSVSIAEPSRLPIGGHATVKVHCATVAQMKTLPRAREWRLISPTASFAVPVHVDTADAADTLTVDLRTVAIPADDYRLEATWDWARVPVSGLVRVRPFADLATATISATSQDRLIAGTGTVAIDLAGADFEFVDRAAMAPAGTARSVLSVSFRLPDDTANNPLAAQAVVDTGLLHPGSYVLTLTQLNGAAQAIPVAVHPPTPTLTSLPLRANLGDARQTLRLHGTGVERIERITSPDATWTLAPSPQGAHDLTEREVEIQLGPNARRGEHLSASLFIDGLHAPLEIDDAAVVLDPRPKITGIDVSFVSQTGVALRPGEVPAGVPIGFAIRADGLGPRPSIQLVCRGESTPSLMLASGERSEAAALDRTGQNTLFLSVDPDHIVAPGCVLDTAVLNSATGVSDPSSLGRVIRLPQIDSFVLTNETIDGRLYAGLLTGESLELIERSGWTADAGWPVQGIATPVPGRAQKQTLQIALRWPSPSPQAPLYIWLRDETEARRTNVKY
jgi:hypothetical protein